MCTSCKGESPVRSFPVSMGVLQAEKPSPKIVRAPQTSSKVRMAAREVTVAMVLAAAAGW